MKIASMSCWLFKPAGLRAQLEDGEAGGVVDEDFALGELRRGGGQRREIALGEEAVAHVAQVHPGPRAEQPLHELLAAHFQREDGDRLALQLDRHVLGDVHGERRFAHGRARRDDDHLRRVQAVASSCRASAKPVESPVMPPRRS